MSAANSELEAIKTFLQDRKSPEVKNFYIFGQGISFSMSPTIHLAGFRHYELPHSYEIHQTKTVDELSSLVSSPGFGGASVTMPHKLAIGKFCSRVTEHARIIGAVNTIILNRETNIQLEGDNTDWTGLVEILRQKSKNASNELETGLVIGAGGASRAALYAMYQQGLKTIYLFNRTKSRAEDIARDFATLFEITILNNLEEFLSHPYTILDVIIGTIPAEYTMIGQFPPAFFAKPNGICIDMSYKPRHTPLLAAALRYGRDWTTVTGVEVLLEQAFGQFELWTGEKAPKAVMREALAARDCQLAAENRD